jgi:hypothetical protein
MAEEPHTRVVVVPTAMIDAAPPPPEEAGWRSPLPHAGGDPPPLASREQWIWDLRWSKGDVYLLQVLPWDAGVIRETPRVMGRFAIELYKDKLLVERVRFDFPGLLPPEPDAGHFGAPSFQAKLTTRIGVIFPKTSKGNKLELVDRATGQRWELPWPPADADAGH